MRYLAKGEERLVPAGEVIYRAGEPIGARQVFYLVEGSVRIERSIPGASPFTYAVEKDNIFGAVCSLSGDVWRTDAHAVENCQLYVWTVEAFEGALSLYIEFARLAIQSLSQYLRAVNREAEKVWIDDV